MSYSLASVAGSDQVVWFAFAIGGAAVGLTVLVTMQVILLRQILRWRSRQRDEFNQRWRPLMMGAILGDPGKFPQLRPRHHLLFLELWNQLQESVRGEARQGLNTVARAVGADNTARRLAVSGSGGERLLGLMTLGRLADPRDRESVLHAAREDDSYVSIVAARALVRIDAVQAVNDLLPLLARRRDWPSAKILAIFREAGAAAVSAPLVKFLPRVRSSSLARVLPLLGIINMDTSAILLKRVLARAKDPDLIAGALKLVFSPKAADSVRKFLTHGDWRVRVQAATAIGRIGSWRDMERLASLLGDREWWVRYRAAQAIAHLPGVTPQDLQRLRNRLTDPFARDMLAHATNEAGQADQSTEKATS